MERVKLRFAGRVIEFADRDRALGQVAELAERGTWWPLVIYGPEGCGKTALLRQAKAILEDHGYHVVLVNPLAEELGEALAYTPTLRDLIREAISALPDPLPRIVEAAISIASAALRRLSRPRIALLLDDVFQAVGLDRAERLVKTLLNLIEYPPGDYDRVVVLVTSSEGVTRERIGRHRWATMRIIWNMPMQGFEQLYQALPGPKPPFEDAWRWTGGNPEMLEALHRTGWNTSSVAQTIARERGVAELVWSLDPAERETLTRAVDDPDTLARNYREARTVIEKLVEKNLIIRVWDRNPDAWIDQPPPERDPELGIGRFYAWQTPLHRDAVKRALNNPTDI